MIASLDDADTSSTGMTDFAECLRRVAVDRDRASFAVVFDYYGPRVKAFMISRRIDPAKAEDLAQDVMLTVWRRAELYDSDKASVSTWIFTIARNRMIDEKRSESRRPDLLQRDPSQDPDAPMTPEDEHIQQTTTRRVAIAIAKLSEPQATVLRMSFVEGESHHRIAERLALPLGTVKSRIRLAKQRLFELLGENHE